MKKLYKYHPVDKYALCALARKKIWATNPRKFVDPFDCAASLLLVSIHNPPMYSGPGGSGGMTQGPIMESSLSTEQTKWVEEMGVYCLCLERDNPLLWGHYADHFRGFCLEYTFDEAKSDELVDVVYPKDNRRPTGNWPEDRLEFIKQVARYKANGWDYEYETRVVFETGGQYYERPAITGIIFGTFCKPWHKKLISRLIDDPGLRPERVYCKPDSFDLVFEEDS